MTELGAFMRTEFLYISAKPKTYRQAPTHWLKFYEEAVIVWGPSRRRAIKEWSKAFNNDWVDN